MIELLHNELVFTCPEVHPGAKVTIMFIRTLRIPDDGKDYPLPPGLGKFPLKHVDDFSKTISQMWLKHGGVFFPMYQSEALWLLFGRSYMYEHRRTGYPFAIKIATGKINAVNGMPWEEGLKRDPQNYVVAPSQPWLDGYCVEKGIIRQFVAMPLGEGYTAEEQLTREAEHGGIQIQVFPMKRDIVEKRFPDNEQIFLFEGIEPFFARRREGSKEPEMGVVPGGRMKQEIYKDPYDISDWDTNHTSRCFAHIANSQVWKKITGENPPDLPLTAKEYSMAGLPWFEYYSDEVALKGSKKLEKLKSVKTMGQIKNEEPLPENESVEDFNIVELGRKAQQIREGEF